MRMWCVNPSILCNQHLLGEHVELHMLIGSISKGRSINGFLINGLVDPSRIKFRHEELATEMLKRGMNHKSPLELVPNYHYISNPININASLKELEHRCPNCAKRIYSYRFE
jgi:hypothetical protein